MQTLNRAERNAVNSDDAVLSTDVALTHGRKRSKRHLLLLQDQLVVAKLHRGSTLRPRLRLALHQLWVLSASKEVALPELEQQQQETSDEDATSIVLMWPSGSCIATFGSQALKELWLRTLQGAQGAQVSSVTSIKGLEKELSRCRAGRTRSASQVEKVIEDLKKAQLQHGPVVEAARDGGHNDLSPAAGTDTSGRTRRRWLPWPFAPRRGPAGALRAPGQEGSGCSRALFGQPLAAVCGQDGTLPQPIQDLLNILKQQGPSTEGIFRRAGNTKALQELRQALDNGRPVDMAGQSVLLLAVLLKDFLRSIPSKLLVCDLYEDWMAAMQTASKDKIRQLQGVVKKLPAANVVLLRQLLSVLKDISNNVSSTKMTISNLAICLGTTLLSPPQEEQLELQALLAENEKVKVLVTFLLESADEIFAEETAGMEETPAPLDTSTALAQEEQSGPEEGAEEQAQANRNPDTSVSLPDTGREDGGEAPVLEAQGVEATAALPSTTLNSSTESLAKAEAQTSLSMAGRLVGSHNEQENRRRKRPREEIWSEDRDCPPDSKRRKTKQTRVRKRRKLRQPHQPSSLVPGT